VALQSGLALSFHHLSIFNLDQYAGRQSATNADAALYVTAFSVIHFVRGNILREKGLDV
jgi:hypothetical protein